MQEKRAGLVREIPESRRFIRKTLVKEAASTASTPVLAVDRLEYMDAIHDAIKGLEKARVTLARAC